MISVFVYTGIACFIFFYILSKKLNSGSFKGYSFAEMTVLLLLMRVCPFLMLEERSPMNFAAFAADLILLGAVSEITAHILGGNRREAAVLYLFSPLPIISMICGEPKYILLTFGAAAILLAFVWYVKKKAKGASLGEFLNYFILFSAGTYIAFVDKIFSSSDIKFVTAVSILTVLMALYFAKNKLSVYTDGERNGRSGAEKFGRVNLLHMILLTAVYAAVVFFRIGSLEAPQTSMTMSRQDNSDIVLDLGEYKNVSKLNFFLGYKNNAGIAISDFNEEERKWELFDEDRRLGSVFNWNEVPLERNMRYIGIVFTEQEEYELNELVVVDADGNVLTPVNSGEYPQLFDEQEKYPENTTYYYRTMFDEVYHGRTAYEFLNDLPIYENSHPPLGKKLISLGIAAFGMTPFGWRFVPAIFGIFMVPVMYLFVWKLSHKKFTALVGTVLFCTEFMHFTLSRIATIDIIAAFFMMLMFLCMYIFAEALAADRSFKEQSIWLFLCGISTAFAVATKWTGVYAAIGIAVIFFACILKSCKKNGGIGKNVPYLKKLFGVCFASFIIIPAAVYCLSYIQFSQAYPDKSCIEHAVSNSAHMLSYHSGLNASHPYESEWYEWLVDRRPVLDAFTIVSDGASSTVSTFGNPLILLCGLAALLHNLWLWRGKGSARSGFLVIAYLSMLMPWLFIHRTVFIYQYFICIIIMILMICESLGHMKRPKLTGGVMMVASLILFVMFFPVISGIAADREYVSNVLEWLPTWVFE